MTVLQSLCLADPWGREQGPLSESSKDKTAGTEPYPAANWVIFCCHLVVSLEILTPISVLFNLDSTYTRCLLGPGKILPLPGQSRQKDGSDTGAISFALAR